jgi:hypothetical protein
MPQITWPKLPIIAIQPHPKPTPEGWHLQVLQAYRAIDLLPFVEKTPKLPVVTVENYLSPSDLPSGIYVLILSDQSKSTIERHILLKQ